MFSNCFILIKRFLFLISLLLSLSPLSLNAQNAQWVNPFIGTGKSAQFTMWGNYGGTYPGAVSPWGAVQLTPETSKRPSEKGYYFEDSKILFFSCHSHLSGYPNGSHGRLQLSFWPSSSVPKERLAQGRSFSHSKEKASPGYYAVTLDHQDTVEMTATPRNGLYRYFSSAQESCVVMTDAGDIEVMDPQTIRCGLKHTIIRLNRPMKSYILQKDTAQFCFSREDTQNGLELWLSVSDRNFEGSEVNAQEEIREWNFDLIKNEVYQKWDKELSCIQIDGSRMDDKVKFYTALYHAMILPCNVSDVNEKHPRFWVYSAWDTFRTLHPMLSLLKPERQLERMNYLMQAYRETGKLPKGPMTGFHIIAVLLDAWTKGTIDATPAEMLAASEALLEQHKHLPAVWTYLDKGFVDAQIELSVSITAELAYNDWTLSRLAYLTGDTLKGNLYKERACNYRHLLDAETGFMLPREGDVFLRKAGELGFQESDRWTGSYFVPHNVQDLINRSGGDFCFANRLAQAFDEGRILFDNEPVFHYPYLFTWAGRPDLTTRYVHRVMEKDFLQSPGGITGNDDLGSMSSWYVLSAIGLFPACPGSGEYLLSTPLFERISFPMDDHQLTISKKGEAPDGTVPSIWIDGKRLNRWFLSHQELIKCRSIVFDGTRPVSDFELYERPYSLTKEKTDFSLKVGASLSDTMKSGSNNHIPFQVTNRGETGLFTAFLKEGKEIRATKRILMEKGATVSDSLTFTCYPKGKHRLELGDEVFTVKVKKNKQLEQSLACVEIDAPAVLSIGDSLQMSFRIMNQSEKKEVVWVPIFLDHRQVKEILVSMESGKEQTFALSLPPQSAGMKEISILGQKQWVKVFEEPQQACILSLIYGASQTEGAKDVSGFDNHATGYGNLLWKDQYVQTGYQAYLSLPSSKSLMTCHQEVTLLTWISPQEKPVGHADFFTKGEYGCLKMEGPNKLVFFFGGWGRGVCEVQVPDDWYHHWHLIAGVCTGPSIQLYIDGELMQEIAVKGKLQANEAPWNIGRNAEIPYSRYWKARMAGTRIYGKALTDKDIKNMYLKEKTGYIENN